MEKNSNTKDLAALGLSDFAPYLMNRIMHRYNQSLHAAISPLGLSVPKMRALAALAAHVKLTVNELAVYAVSEQSTMSRTVDQMERDGLILRSVSSDDNRVRFVSLTDAGIAAYQSVWPQMQAAETAMLVDLDPKTRALFLETLNKILKTVRVNEF